MKPKRNALGQFAPRRRRNPERSLSAAISDAEIRRRVASEASTQREHRSMATAYRSEVERAMVRRDRMAANFYARMADGHSSMAHSLAGVASARRR